MDTKPKQSKNLFSDHFLDNRLCNLPEWEEECAAVFIQLANLMNKAKLNGSSWNEAQTETEFIQPVLYLLGWKFIPQVKAGRRTRPDYALFLDEKTKDDAYPHQGNDTAFYSRATVIAEAKYWSRPLSHKDTGNWEPWDKSNNPSYQIVSYLDGAKVEWGILTNGCNWRLYSRNVSSTASEFYEVDLRDVFDFYAEGNEPSTSQLEHFKHWWLFFRRDAFTQIDNKKTFIHRALEDSTSYAREISNKLKELVFKEVMPVITGGFVAYRNQELDIKTENDESLSEIYKASLHLLYKLLFILYAEARGLLPMDNQDYKDNSLDSIAKWAAQQLDAKRPISNTTYASEKYERLKALFIRIDRGDPSLGIPHYNGGLFSPGSPENNFLDLHKLSDLVVAKAIDVLVRDEGSPVDYAYISVRNLGSIYEGLLENKLKVIDAAIGKVELINDKGERKATGSYYTPDYIVEYIVKNTLGPVLEEKQKEFADGMGKLSKIHQKLEKTVDSTTNRLLRQELEYAERQAREAFLGIKVLDPAMGSGHFLVNAVDYLTDGIIQKMQAYHDAHPETKWEWDPIQQLLERIRTEIIEEMKVQGLNIDTRRLEDTALLTRLVMKRCIYGVDLNPMAVELAKVSLWLHSFTVGAPLSFLDHHLRCGNSLIGADVRSVELKLIETRADKKISARAKKIAKGRGEASRKTEIAFIYNLFSGPFAGLLDLTALMVEVAERADATLADVHTSSQSYTIFQHELEPYKQALNLWVSQFFGNADAVEFLTYYGDNVIPILKSETKENKPILAKHKTAIDKAREINHEKRFFHWDLEFPEVFIDIFKRDWAENGGFDAVIGNPPYLSAPAMVEDSPDIREYLTITNSDYLFMKWDLYCAFLTLEWRLLTGNGKCIGMIIPNQFLYQDYARKLRVLFAREAKIINIVDLGNTSVFEQAVVMTCILCLKKTLPDPQHNILVKVTHEKQLLSIDVKDNYHVSQSLFLELPNNVYRLAINQPEANLINKILGQSIELGKLCYGSVGVVPHSEKMNKPKEDYIFPEKKNDKCKKYIEGKNAGRYFIDWDGRWLEYNYHIVRRPSLPELLESPKIALKIVSGKTGLNACFDPDGIYTDHSFVLFALKARLLGVKTRQINIDPAEALLSSKFDILYILGIINSRLINWFFEKYLSSDLNIGPDDAKKLPIRNISFNTATEIRSIEKQKILPIFKSSDNKKLLDFALNHLPLQFDIVQDILAFLAEQMIDLNNTRQTEIKGFLVWLSSEIGTQLEDLTGKTFIQNYLGDYQKGEEPASIEQILGVLRKNERKLSIKISRSFKEKLALEYQASLDKLLPIKKKLADTDWLIDQIVYALYGLTKEEIDIVEGKVKIKEE